MGQSDFLVFPLGASKQRNQRSTHSENGYEYFPYLVLKLLKHKQMLVHYE
jgi:hypothetical protein